MVCSLFISKKKWAVYLPPRKTLNDNDNMTPRDKAPMEVKLNINIKYQYNIKFNTLKSVVFFTAFWVEWSRLLLIQKLDIFTAFWGTHPPPIVQGKLMDCPLASYLVALFRSASPFRPECFSQGYPGKPHCRSGKTKPNTTTTKRTPDSKDPKDFTS